MTEQKMRAEAREAVIETLKWYDGYYSDLHHEAFNSDYYIVGTYQAKKALEKFGIFDAIEKVQEYERQNFGEIYTDLSDPEKLVNMLYYIIGEEVLFEMMDGIDAFHENYDNLATGEINKEILAALGEEI